MSTMDMLGVLGMAVMLETKEAASLLALQGDMTWSVLVNVEVAELATLAKAVDRSIGFHSQPVAVVLVLEGNHIASNVV